MGVYWAGVEQSGREGSGPLRLAAGAPPARPPCRASALGVQSVASSGRGEEGCYWCDLGLEGCKEESSNSGFLTSISPVCSNSRERDGGEGKGRRSETSWGLIHPVPSSLGLNPSPAGRSDDGGDLVVTHQDPAITPGKALPPCQEQSEMLGWGDDVQNPWSRMGWDPTAWLAGMGFLAQTACLPSSAL